MIFTSHLCFWITRLQELAFTLPLAEAGWTLPPHEHQAMNDEPHSHKKATVALVTILLLAYVGSYLWMRQNKSRMVSFGGTLRNPPKSEILCATKEGHFLSASSLEFFYKPLRFLEYKATGTEVHFVFREDPSENFRRLNEKLESLGNAAPP